MGADVMPDAEQLQQRLDWMMRSIGEARHRHDVVILHGSVRTDFDGFLSRLEWIATGSASVSPDAEQLQQRLDWMMRRIGEARHDVVILDGSARTDFDGFLSRLEWIATGSARESNDEYPPLGQTMTDYGNQQALIRTSELSNMSDDEIDALIQRKGYAWAVGVLQERLNAVHSVASIALGDKDE